MTPFFICLVAFGIVFIAVQMGARMGAFLALSGMLGAALALLVTFRYWFLVCRLLERAEQPVAIHSLIIFWGMFCGVAFVFSRLRQNYIETFESTQPSLLDRGLGGLFGLGTGTMIMAALMMTFSILAAEYWHGYQRAELPLPMDQWAQDGYQFVETHLAGIGPKEAGHTPLPALDEKGAKKASDVWR
jgi:hypothetical protein